MEETTVPYADSGLHGKPASQLGTVLTLFMVLRLTVLFFYTQQGLFNNYIDYHHYYRTALLSEQGFFPFINMWYEYPPILAYLPQLAYWLAGAIITPIGVDSFSYQLFIRILGLFLLVFDALSLVLVHDISKRLWGMEKANWTAWVCATLSLPLFYWSFSHQGVVVFFLLLSIWFFLRDRHYPSAVALGLGIASKITPIFLLLPILRFLWPRWKKILVVLSLVILVVAAVYLPFLFLGGIPWIAASFTALSRVGSYGTIWAVIDGNWGPGNYGELATRLDLSQAFQTHANPALIPGWILLLVFAVIYGIQFVRPIQRHNQQHFIWFTTLTALFFHLWSRGWSPQWSLILVPLFLLSFPDRRGLGWTLALTGLVFLEWPVAVSLDLKSIAVLWIVLRSGLFISIAVYMIRQLWPAQHDKIPSNV